MISLTTLSKTVARMI